MQIMQIKTYQIIDADKYIPTLTSLYSTLLYMNEEFIYNAGMLDLQYTYEQNT